MWSDNRQRLRRLSFDAAFLGLALILSYVEALFPVSMLIPLPGFKLGLANLIVLWVAINRTALDAGMVSFLRVLIVAMLFGSPVSFCFSLGGAFCSFLTILLARKISIFSYIGISVLSATAHNFGQLLAASCFFGINTMWVYLPVMLVSAVIFGSLCGILLNLIAPRLEGRNRR